ncbi:hypothetical protein [Marinilactibacillus sp. Marseille-P9653]|uniref:hypothetical protein n=1 Tax=Marinilactibacillus sp. Marseille-P9653 TaxID=2866583 RepID=UPI001CE453F2|nr:hypothetical protein [Marinilactibacillus sp. Marseille-P9653]
MKKVFLFSTLILLLSACGNNETAETDETNELKSEQTSEITDSNQTQEDADVEETEAEEDSSENSDSDLSDESNQEDTEMTEEEAKEKVIAYINEQSGPTEAESYNFNIVDEGEVYTASMYTSVSTDETKGAPIISMHEINKTTGEVKKIEVGPYDLNTATSEIASMSEEERKAHHRELVAEGESIDESVLEQLMLPGVHKNTTFYEGRINAGDTVELSLATADTPPEYEKLEFSPDIDTEGFFTINLSPYDLTHKSVFRFSIQGDYSNEQIFDIPIFEAQEGMENIGVRE